MTAITTTATIGSYDYEIEASATIHNYIGNQFEIDDIEINILKDGEMIVGKEYDNLMNNLDVANIEDLLIENYGA